MSLIAEHCEGPLPYVLAIVISLLFVGQGTLTQREGELIYHKHTTVIQPLTKKTAHLHINIHCFIGIVLLSTIVFTRFLFLSVSLQELLLAHGLSL